MNMINSVYDAYNCRFNGEGTKTFKILEKIVLFKDTSDELEMIVKLFKDDFNWSTFDEDRKMIRIIIKKKKVNLTNIAGVTQFLQEYDTLFELNKLKMIDHFLCLKE